MIDPLWSANKNCRKSLAPEASAAVAFYVVRSRQKQASQSIHSEHVQQDERNQNDVADTPRDVSYVFYRRQCARLGFCLAHLLVTASHCKICLKSLASTLEPDTVTDATATTDTTAVREVLAQHGRLTVDIQTLDEDFDLYGAGLTSLATVGIMLALEDRFEIEFPESMLSRSTFRSVSAIAEAVARLAG
ncbi:MAG: acyl carrier protein [Planctomycetes bacterium]|nr:acyl carrier protein [Planctomycetota bacterium]